MSALTVRVKENEGGVATSRSSCAKAELTSNLEVGISAGGDSGNGGVTPYGLSKSTSLASAEKCEKWVDKDELGSYKVDLDVIRPGDSEFSGLYRKLTEGHTDSAGVDRPPVKQPKDIAAAPSFGAGHDTNAKVVCLTRLTTRDLTDAGNDAEVNIGLTSSNFAEKLETFWPR